MDEPLSSLDIELNQKLREEILRLQREFGFALLYVTHDREGAYALAERIVVMKHGRMAFEGSPERVKTELGAQDASEMQ